MPVAFNNTDILFAAWGGLQRCKTRADCYANSLTKLYFPTICGKLSGSPAPGRFCRCDYGMAGESCELSTTTSTVRAILSCLLLPLFIYVVARAILEVWARGKPKWKTTTAAVVSLWLSLVAGMLSLIANTIVIVLTLRGVGSGDHGYDEPTIDLFQLSKFQFTVAVPGAFVFVLSGALVILVIWRRVAEASRAGIVMKKTTQKSIFNLEKFLAFLCIAFFTVISLLLYLGLGKIFNIVIAVSYAVYACWLYHEGKNFTSLLMQLGAVSRLNRSAMSTDVSETEKRSELDMSLTNARTAMKYISIGMWTVVLGLVIVYIGVVVLGRSMQANQLDMDVVGKAILFFGWANMVMWCVAYVRHCRLTATGGPKKSKRKSLRRHGVSGSGDANDRTANTTSPCASGGSDGGVTGTVNVSSPRASVSTHAVDVVVEA